MSALSTQSTTPATVPSGTAIAADQVGTANAPATGDRIQYVKLDVGAAGSSSPVVTTVPVSGTVTANATLAAETTKVIGTVNVAASQTIAVTQATAANLNATVTPPAITKGTQGATGFTTQDLKDSGRVAISFTAEFSPTAVTEALLTMTISKDGATATTGSTYTITSGKRLRLASKSMAVENTLGTSIQRAYLRTRFNTAGAVTTSSPLQANLVVAAAGTVKSVSSNFDDYPDGMEFLGDGTKTIGWSLQAPDWVTGSATLKVYITIIAFEY